MTHFGMLLVVYSFVTSLVLNVFLLIRFLARAQNRDIAMGELVHTILFGIMRKPYRSLLLRDGIQPSYLDELLHAISILLIVCSGIGLILIAFGLVWRD